MIIRMIQEGGPGAYLAIAFGMLGLLLGGVSLVMLLGKNRAAFGLGIVTLIVAMAAAGAGMGGTAWGRSQTTNALASVDSEIDKERIMRAGFREAQSASWIGLFAALLPLVLGAAAAVGGSRLQQPKTRAQFGGDQMAAADEGTGQTVVALIFFAIGAIACGGAWAMAHSELPKLRYAFDEMDTDSWELASALDDIRKDRKDACRRLEDALGRFWEPSNRQEWPRKMRTIAPELAAWRPAADDCAKQLMLKLGGPREGGNREISLKVTQATVLESPLLQDDALRARVLAWKEGGSDEPEEAQEDAPAPALGSLNPPPGKFDEPKVGTASLAPEVIRAVIQRNLSALRYCYEVELTKTPTLEGKVVVNFAIGKDGSVASATDASEPAFPNTKVTACVLGRFKKMRFPAPSGGGVVNVKYPLVFKSAG